MIGHRMTGHRMTGRRRTCRLLSTVALGAVLTGGLGACTGDEKPERATPTTARATGSGDPATPDGYRPVAVEAEGFALAIPADWKDIPLTAEELAPFLEANPEITRLVGDDPAAFLERTKFFAYDDSGSGTNVNVVKSPAEGASVDDLVAGLHEVLVGQLKAKEVSVERADAPAGRAARASYVLPFNLPDGSTADVTQVQYHFIKGDVDYVVTFTLFGEFIGRDLPDRVVRAFRLT